TMLSHEKLNQQTLIINEHP
ncbi:unnamed protein product, partial [Rotaria sp. Silwood1]